MRFSSLFYNFLTFRLLIFAKIFKITLLINGNSRLLRYQKGNLCPLLFYLFSCSCTFIVRNSYFCKLFWWKNTSYKVPFKKFKDFLNLSDVFEQMELIQGFVFKWSTVLFSCYIYVLTNNPVQSLQIFLHLIY